MEIKTHQDQICRKCNNPYYLHRPAIFAHHSECVREEFSPKPTVMYIVQPIAPYTYFGPWVVRMFRAWYLIHEDSVNAQKMCFEWYEIELGASLGSSEKKPALLK